MESKISEVVSKEDLRKAIEKAKKLKQKAVDNNEIIKKDENNNTK